MPPSEGMDNLNWEQQARLSTELRTKAGLAGDASLDAAMEALPNTSTQTSSQSILRH